MEEDHCYFFDVLISTIYVSVVEILTAGPGGPTLPAAPGKPVAPLTKDVIMD